MLILTVILDMPVNGVNIRRLDAVEIHQQPADFLFTLSGNITVKQQDHRGLDDLIQWCIDRKIIIATHKPLSQQRLRLDGLGHVNSASQRRERFCPFNICPSQSSLDLQGNTFA